MVTLLEAAYAIRSTGGKVTWSKTKSVGESKEALAFIKGTGLDIMLEYYGLAYDADLLRESFLERFNLEESA